MSPRGWKDSPSLAGSAFPHACRRTSSITEAYVYGIAHSPDGVTAYAPGLTVQARRAIITLPPALAGRIKYDPPLAAARDHLTESTAMGWVIKVHCIYPTRFWQQDNLSGAVASDKIGRAHV